MIRALPSTASAAAELRPVSCRPTHLRCPHPHCGALLRRVTLDEGLIVRTCDAKRVDGSVCGQRSMIVAGRGRATVVPISKDEAMGWGMAKAMEAAAYAIHDGMAGAAPAGAPADPTAALTKAQRDVLSLLCRHGGMNAADVGRAIGLPRSTARSHLAALVLAGAVRRDGNTKGATWTALVCNSAQTCANTYESEDKRAA